MLLSKHLLLFWHKPTDAIGHLLDHGSFWHCLVWVGLAYALAQIGINQTLEARYQAVPYQASYKEFLEDQGYDLEQLPQVDLDENSTFTLTKRLPLPLVGEALYPFMGFSWGDSLRGLMAICVLFPVCILLILNGVRQWGYPASTNEKFLPLSYALSQAWSAVFIPLGFIGILLNLSLGQASGPFLVVLVLLGHAIFLFWAAICIRNITGAPLAVAVGVSALWIPILIPVKALSGVWYFLLSPLFLWYFGMMILNKGNDSRRAFSRGQSFKQHLEALTINPNDADAHLQIAQIYRDRHQFEDAFRHFDRARQIDPEDPDGHFGCGQIHQQHGEYDLALQCFDRALAINPRHAQWEPLRERGKALLQMGRVQEAIADLEAYHSNRPYDPNGLFHLAQATQSMGQIERAETLYKETIEAVDTAPAYRKSEIFIWARQAKSALSKLKSEKN
ncbi:MAG: tetratricopeptide repeat protein [Acidobacteria bacterium]|nr:tetratricopeptide repeat protein [Acidobacteriota bacterium]MCB9399503.1 tetratricopeptide repeat protein [Acidobacteriota bacterium]